MIKRKSGQNDEDNFKLIRGSLNTAFFKEEPPMHRISSPAFTNFAWYKCKTYEKVLACILRGEYGTPV